MENNEREGDSDSLQEGLDIIQKIREMDPDDERFDETVSAVLRSCQTLLDCETEFDEHGNPHMKVPPFEFYDVLGIVLRLLIRHESRL